MILKLGESKKYVVETEDISALVKVKHPTYVKIYGIDFPIFTQWGIDIYLKGGQILDVQWTSELSRDNAMDELIKVAKYK